MFTIGFFVGVLIAILFAIVAWLIFNRITTGHWSVCRREYDERQKVAQGLAYRDTFWTMIVLLWLWLMVQLAELPLPVSDAAVTLLIIFVGIAVYAVECIFRDAYMGLHDKPVRWVVLSLSILVINLIVAWSNYNLGNTAYWVNLMCSVMLGVVLAAFGIKALMKRGSESGENE